jgi:sulfonate transport system substrate-binding protein
MFSQFRRAISVTMGVLAAVAVLVGCGPAAAGSGGSSGVTLTIGDQANGLQTLLTAAGVLTGTSYQVKFAEFQGAAPLFQAMQSGQVDTGTAADLPTLQAISGGLPIKLVAASHTSGAGTAILVQPGSAVRSVGQLKGQTVVVSSAKGSIAEYLLAKALQQNGLSYTDVKVEYLLPTAAEAAFSNDKIQIWATFDPYYAIAAKSGGRLLVDGQNNRTSGYGFISAASASLANPAKKAAISDFLTRLAKAETWARTNSARYATIYSQHNGVATDVATQVVNRSHTALVPVSPQVVSTVQAVADLMHQIGSLSTDVRVASVAYTTAYPVAVSN